MDTAPLKSFATSARIELIREVGARITAVLAPGSPERVEQPGAVTALERTIAAAGGGDKGKAHVADKVAYTWFNRIIALRFMDANGYTGIGVVSPAAEQVGQPEVLAAAKRGQIDGDVVKGAYAATIAGLLNGTRQPRPGVDAQAEAYALLLTDYCRYWNKSMPFMFEREGDYTELLIPANLLAEDSVLNRSVKVLTEEVCQDVEVIGWLYQFYISERKDEVFAGFKKNKKAGADEIPAATQLFTPHWIVRYLVENSVGRLWMLNHPESRLIDQMDYYIAPVDEETDFLKITTPEELTVIDPACGSGHMLTYAFDLLYAIYEEEGFTPSQIPSLILTNNLYGTEIDPRAGALAAFALTMKAAAKRKLFLKNPVDPNICVLEPISFSADELSYLVTKDGDQQAEEAFWNQFADADTFGSLIQPDRGLTARLAHHVATLDDEGDILRADALDWAQQVIRQAEILLPGYSVVVANPPYMGAGNMGPRLADFAKSAYPQSKSDSFAMFIDRSRCLVGAKGLVGMITMQSWMFLGSYEKLRESLLSAGSVATMAHLGSGAFDSIAGEVVSTTAFVLAVGSDLTGTFVQLTKVAGEAIQAERFRELVRHGEVHSVSRAALRQVPGFPIAYWLSDAMRHVFSFGPLGDRVAVKKGLDTGDNARFLRLWFEVARADIGLGYESEVDAAASAARWFPMNKGGERRRWYGNQEVVIDWKGGGAGIRSRVGVGARGNATIRNPAYFFRRSLGWTMVTSTDFSIRAYPTGFLFGSGGGGIFGADDELLGVIAVLNSVVMNRAVNRLSPTVNFDPGPVSKFPLAPAVFDGRLAALAERLIEIHMVDARRSELSWEFQAPELLRTGVGLSLRERLESVATAWRSTVREAMTLEEDINRIAADIYGVGAELDTSVAQRDLTLSVLPDVELADVSDAGYAQAMRGDAMESLVSYAVGCLFGRYSLDEPGLILADQGATFQDYLTKVPNPTFTPDADNVIPIVDGDWFEDDIVERFRQFLHAAFGEQHFEENLQFVTESLGVKHLRDYFVKSFYKDHVQRYKKRPIYWMFSSPKGSFNALIYMHRYTPSMVSTVLTYLREYVTKLESALHQAERVGNAKEADRLRKILVELNEYEHDTLFPKASENVVIDLDDGVKANYPKFGAALKKIPGLEAASD
ncbi:MULTISPECIES: BREX-1 system adenine-specific DNA-methyltransferase PglX [Microbacterium]|uniref:BREX-1 system adenine-specific DNA-methyltransferase PglX n=1 Tax=Microbacterium TaxID=33882 RepID=UPI0003FF46D6|nr:BREX-1 system adenine-specific DNA-methyltransferase PglX [Microbacterium gubbeenense]